MPSDQQVLLEYALEEIPSALTQPDSHGLSESIVTGEPQFWGDHIRVPIDPSLSYGRVQGLAPAWLTVLKVDNGVAHLTIDEANAEAALTE